MSACRHPLLGAPRPRRRNMRTNRSAGMLDAHRCIAFAPCVRWRYSYLAWTTCCRGRSHGSFRGDPSQRVARNLPRLHWFTGRFKRRVVGRHLGLRAALLVVLTRMAREPTQPTTPTPVGGDAGTTWGGLRGAGRLEYPVQGDRFSKCGRKHRCQDLCAPP